MRTDRCDVTGGQECHKKEEEKKLKYKNLSVQDKTGVEFEV